MTESAPFLVFGFGILLVGAVAYFAYVRAQKRRETLAAYALSKGWAFEATDVYGQAHRWKGPPFARGDDRRAYNVLRGFRGSQALVAFDYKYDETSGSGSSRSEHTYHLHVCSLRLPAALPPLAAVPETALSRIGQLVGVEDIELESEAFNRAFRVQAPSAKFACDVLTPRQMELLLRLRGLSWRIEGADLLCYAEGAATPGDIESRIAALAAFTTGIPAFVWKDNGYDPSPLEGAQEGYAS